jgi:hypothetical protein
MAHIEKNKNIRCIDIIQNSSRPMDHPFAVPRLGVEPAGQAALHPGK